jgi:hypothetical protein
MISPLALLSTLSNHYENSSSRQSWYAVCAMEALQTLSVQMSWLQKPLGTVRHALESVATRKFARGVMTSDGMHGAALSVANGVVG